MGRSSLTGQLILVFNVSFVCLVDCCDSRLPDMAHMDLLSKFGVTVNQTREEFIDALCTHQLSNLKTLRQDLFMILVSNDQMTFCWMISNACHWLLVVTPQPDLSTRFLVNIVGLFLTVLSMKHLYLAFC